ncbi:MAG TPA: flagellar motor switch protein FliN [Anaerolineales bacterium]|nr:flagellar motor switch protein FliN [Anaerolineales bacterium]HNN13757.1 flagellar motor switch protein FliN [Anaerolineales bacterium]HNO30447.1 flagellar motor switch protein FliN [Anaerolineales bacterium]
METTTQTEEMRVKTMPEGVAENPVKSDASSEANINLLMDVSLRVTVELGRTRMKLAQILELQHGSVVELDRLAGDPVDVFVNDRMVAHGEVVVVDDKFGVRITEMISAANEKVTI